MAINMRLMLHHERTIRALLIILIVAFGNGYGRAQEVTTSIPLFSTQYDIVRLVGGTTSAESKYEIGGSVSSIIFDVVSTVDNVATTITGPNGDVITDVSVVNYGGSYVTWPALSLGEAPPLPFSTRGFHTIITIPSLGNGQYVLRFQVPQAVTDSLPVMVSLITDDSLAVNLFSTEKLIVVDNPVVLVAAIYDDDKPIVNANVSVKVSNDAAPQTTFLLKDDGIDPDQTVGDGLYSGEFNPNAAGQYRAIAGISGIKPGGAQFSRQSSTEFSVVAPSGGLTGTFSDNGVDDNSNGLYDRVVVNVETSVDQPGDYGVFVHLRLANGQEVVRSSITNLSSGLNSVSVNFEASALKALGENGPYKIDLIELVFNKADGSIPTDRLINVGQTKAYQLSQFEQPPIVVTGNTTDSGIDTNSNGQFDILKIEIEIGLLNGGSYQWSARLVDSKNNEIGLASKSGVLSVGTNTIVLSFDGKKIGLNGVDGPYFVKDLLIFGAGKSLIENDVGTTQAYKFTAFEGAPVPKPGDLNGDGAVTCVDLAIVKDSFGKRTGQAKFDVRADVNKDGIVDIRDLSFVSRLLPTGTKCS
jgi:hypothetical protein